MGFCSDDCGPKRRVFPGGDCEGCGDEQALFDSIASEPAKLAGTSVAYYKIRRAKHRHSLYKEPSVDGDWSFEGPWELAATLDFPQSDNVTPTATENGIESTAEAVAWVSRKEFEDRSAPYPQEGSVLEFWWTPPFAQERQKSQWDIVKATRDGNIFNSEAFTMYKLELRSRSKFFAFRKTEGDTGL